MPSPPCFPFSVSGPLSKAVAALGFSSFEQLAAFVQALPYGRTAANDDPLSVITENCGTCSSKHKLLAALAHECGHMEVQLTVGLFKMSEENTPGVGSILRAAHLSYIPEAHCYLAVGSKRYDFTGLPKGSASPFEALIEEHVVLPAELSDAKIELHKRAVAHWAASAGITTADAWATREACIAALSANTSFNRDGLKPAR
ncbi:hypothetical protein [Jeongeupia sp. HS-3]|uniref:hypothetical protein n=1 Tax=Jeongeupia sp. HS-3 TaxID=1009682 RepID=UPI0019106BCC|nr:hypothetical protein [Jeongeupia sp. HS-3]